MPKTAVLENWAKTTPEDFRFAIKASRRITHMSRLKADTAADSVNFLYTTLAALGAKRGPVLFQLPPFLKKDLPRLIEFLTLLPEGHSAAFEFRNDSWFDDDVYDALENSRRFTVPSPSAKTTHLRLSSKQQTGATSVCVSKRIRTPIFNSGRQRLAATAWREIYVYFMHEPTAPAYAQTLSGSRLLISYSFILSVCTFLCLTSRSIFAASFSPRSARSVLSI